MCVHAYLVMFNSFVTPWTVGCQIPLSMEFPRQDYWSELSFPSVREVWYFLSSVSLQQNFEVTNRPVLQLHVTAQLYLQTKENVSLRCEGGPTQKTQREEKPKAQFWLLFLYVFFSTPWTSPMETGLARSAVCFTSGPHSGPQTFLCSILAGFFPPLSFSHCHFGLLFLF